MTGPVITATEVIFNISYLLMIWVVVISMYIKKENLKPVNKKLGNLFLMAFFLLAMGDTGHVGFRLIAIFSGGLVSNPFLVGLGALATAVTITLFYMLFAEIWRVRFGKKRNAIWWTLIIVGIIRLGIMIPSGNSWTSGHSPFEWSLARNIPLILQGLVVSGLMYIDARPRDDKMMTKIAYLILVSYACYLPVILFAHKVPILGMLMIPKTLAYLAIAFIVHKLFNDNRYNLSYYRG